MNIVKENIREDKGIEWSGKDPTKLPIIGKIITKDNIFGDKVPKEEYNVVEITPDNKIFILDKWYKPGVPQLIHIQMIDEYIPNER